MGKSINKIGKITIYVNNQEEAKEFWTKKLNFIVKFEQAMGPNMKWIEVGPSDDEFTTFVLYDKNMMKMQNPNASVDHPNVILSTSDIESTYKEMQENKDERDLSRSEIDKATSDEIMKIVVNCCPAN